MLLSYKNIYHLMANQCELTTTVCNLAGMENPAACAPNTQIVSLLPPVARRWTVASAQPVEALCCDFDFGECEIR